MKYFFIALTLAGATFASAQNHLFNGSFENGDHNPNPTYGYEFLEPGSTAITDWTISGSQILRGKNGITYDGLTASDGDFFLDLTGSQNNTMGAVSQGAWTIPGHTYTVSADLGLAPATVNGQGPVTVRAWAGSEYQDWTFDATGTGTQWKTFSFNFTAGFVTATTIKFEGLTKPADNAFVGLDNASVTEAVPEPATLTALGLGLVAIVRRRSKK